MTPTEIIAQATDEGVLLTLSRSGNISAKGDQSAIDHWLPVLKESKAGVIAELQLEIRRAGVLSMLLESPGIRYAIEVVDPNTDPVIVTIGIRNVATWEMSIPQAYYDAFSLLGLIEKITENDYADA